MLSCKSKSAYLNLIFIFCFFFVACNEMLQTLTKHSIHLGLEWEKRTTSEKKKKTCFFFCCGKYDFEAGTLGNYCYYVRRINISKQLNIIIFCKQSRIWLYFSAFWKKELNKINKNNSISGKIISFYSLRCAQHSSN